MEDARIDDDFAAWYERTYPSIRSALAVLIGDEHGADATAEAFARAYQRWDRVSRMASPAGWTYRVAANLARSAHRRSARERLLWRRIHPREPGGDASRLMPGPDVERAVRRLPPRMRHAVVLRYIADMTEGDVAAAMDLSRGGVSSLLVKARAQLKNDHDLAKEGTPWNP